jgi:hypothetical protein
MCSSSLECVLIIRSCLTKRNKVYVKLSDNFDYLMKYAVTKCAADYHFIRYNSVISNNSAEAFAIFFFKNVSSEVYERSSPG